MSQSNWIRPVVLAASCLVLGFVGGWTLATLGGDDVSLPDAKVDVTVEAPNPKTTTIDTPDPVPTPERGTVAVRILNGTTRSGFAATTASTLSGLGYTKVTTGNTPAQSGPTVVYYREGAKPAAEQLAGDLKSDTVAPIDGTPLATSTPADIPLVVVLGV